MTQPAHRLKRTLMLALTAALAIASTGCIVVPGRHGPRAVVVAPPPVHMAPAPVYLAPSYASPGQGWAWEHHGNHGWGWRHQHRGWHHGWR